MKKSIQEKNTIVLVVDDSAETREVIRRELQLLGYSVEEASTAKDAIAKLKDRTFDLLMSDFIMPKGNGIQLIEFARAHHPCLKIILLTGFPLNDEQHKRLDELNVDLVFKPFTIEEICSFVNKCSST